jgi:hypothetical protein
VHSKFRTQGLDHDAIVSLSLCRFAAEVFHGLYDEVMTASARGHGLVLRVQQLEAELPLLEKDICQRDYLYVASNRGMFSTWHKLTSPLCTCIFLLLVVSLFLH